MAPRTRNGTREKTQTPKTSGKVRAAKPSISSDKPSTAQKPSLFFSDESKLAGYLGYKTIGDLRKFRNSFWTIEGYRVFKKIKRHGKMIGMVLELLEDEQTANEETPASLEGLSDQLDDIERRESKLCEDKGDKRQETQQLQGQHDSERMRVLAALLSYQYEMLSSAETIKDDEKILRQEGIKDWIRTVKQDLTIPDFDVLAVVLPTLTQPDFNELGIERYVRIYNIYCSMHMTLAPSRWKSIHSSAEPYPSKFLEESHAPTWMRQQSDDDLDYRQMTGKQASFSRITVILEWVQPPRASYSKSLHTHMELCKTENMSLPKLKKIAADPRIYQSGEQWRDHLRRELGFEKLRINFATLDLVSESGESMSVAFDPNGVLWTDLPQELDKIPSEKKVFRYGVKLLATDDDDDDNDDDEARDGQDSYPYEYEGLPYVLENLLYLDESNEVALQPVRDSVPISAPQDVASKRKQEEVSRQEAADRMRLQRAFLKSSGRGLDHFVKPREVIIKDPEYLISQIYDGHDVRTSMGLRAWQLSTISLCTNDKTYRTQLALKAVKKKIGAEGKAALENAEREINIISQSMDEGLVDHDKHFEIQAAFTGTAAQVGPLVEPSKRLLAMNTVQTERGLDGSECATIRSTLKFLDPQITAAAFMLQRSYGRVPVLNQYDDQEYDQKLVQSGPRTFGGILADSMGMGKTLIANLYLSIAMKSHTTMKGRLHRPTLLIVPGGPVLQQWAKMLQDYFSELNVIQAYGDRPKDGRAALNWVGNIAMKSAPLDLTVWPKHLQYIFKKTDPKADSTIVLTGYDTWVQRTVKTEIRTRKQPNGEEVKYPFYWTDWPNVFDTVIMDEGHRLKNEITRTFLAIDQLDADYHWFLTATPSSNTLADMVGPLRILWKKVQKEYFSSEEDEAWLSSMIAKGSSSFHELDQLELTDPKRLVTMHPEIVKQLAGSIKLANIAEHFHYIDDLISIRRSPASVLIRNERGEKTELKTMIPVFTVKTVDVAFEGTERAIQQYIHRVSARELMDILKNWLGNEGDQVLESESKKSFPPLAAPQRRLSIVSASTHLARFDIGLREIGKDSLVESMLDYQGPGYDLDWLLERTLAKGESIPTRRREKLALIAAGSPVLQFILYQVKLHMLSGATDQRMKKILVLEETPLNAWFYERVLNYMHISTKVLAAHLSLDERMELVNSFNDEDSEPHILIIMYQVNAQGVNLDRACHMVIVASPAINVAQEVQGWGRVLRVSQKHPVTIVRVRVLNSFFPYRESYNVEKVKTELATRARDPPMRVLLVKLLNDANPNILQKQQSPLALNLLAKRSQTSKSEDTDGAKTVNEKLDLRIDMKESTLVTDDRRATATDNEEPDSSPPAVRRSSRQTNAVKRLTSDFAEFGTLDQDDPELSDASSNFDLEPDSDFEVDTNNEDDGESESVGERTEPAEVMFMDTYKVARAFFRSLPIEEQETFNQEEMNLCQIIDLDPTKQYTEEDLDQHDTLDRALRLLCVARFGQGEELMRVSPHINYDAISATIGRDTIIAESSIQALRGNGVPNKQSQAKKVSKASKKSSTKKRRAPEKVECMGTLTPSKAAKRQKVEREAQRQGEELQQALAGIHGEEDESSLK